MRVIKIKQSQPTAARIALTVAITCALAVTTQVSFAQAHSGGLDGNGCHAGSQPYHCHGGGSGGDGGGGTSPDPEPTPAPPVDSGPSAAEIQAAAKKEKAEAAVRQAKADRDAAAKRATALKKDHQNAVDRCNKAKEKLAATESEADDARTQADERRSDLKEERELAVTRVSKRIAAKDEKQLATLHGEQDTYALFAGFFLGLILLRRPIRAAIARMPEAYQTRERRALQLWVLLILAVICFALSAAFSGMVLRFAFSFLSGGLAAGCFVSAAFFWWPRWPSVLRFGGMAIALLIALGSIGALIALEQPGAAKPTAAELEAMAAATEDPDASEDPEANRLDDRAHELDQAAKKQQADVDATQKTVDKAQAQLRKAQTDLAAKNRQLRRAETARDEA